MKLCTKNTLMMEFEISDIMFLVKSMKHPSDHFDIYKFIQFSSHSTRSSSSLKLRHCLSKNNTQSNFYFNSIPSIDISLSLPAIKSNLRAHFWDSFLLKFCPYNPCIYISLPLSLFQLLKTSCACTF